jgi:hypothetical protein
LLWLGIPVLCWIRVEIVCPLFLNKGCSVSLWDFHICMYCVPSCFILHVSPFYHSPFYGDLNRFKFLYLFLNRKYQPYSSCLFSLLSSFYPLCDMFFPSCPLLFKYLLLGQWNFHLSAVLACSLCFSQCNPPPFPCPLSPILCYLTVFSIFPCVLFLHRCGAFHYFLSFFFSSSLGLLFKFNFWIHTLYISLCIYNIACIYIRPIFHTREKIWKFGVLLLLFSIHMCIHYLGHFSPLLPPRPSPPFPPQFQAGHVLHLSLVFLKKRDKPNKEDSVFASWVEDSYTEIFLALLLFIHVMTHVDSSLIDLYPGYWSPSHDNLCCFNISVLVPLEWGHQRLSCFGFSTHFYITEMCSLLAMWSKSNHIAAFALVLKSAYEGEHMSFGLLSLADLTQNDVL